jgi:uncharacterized cofD-like protein
MRKKKIVTIGGGTGSYTVLSGLKKYDLDIAAVVSMADDGGSTGRLRDELGVLPPGDVRQCLVALSKETQVLRDLFNYRFEAGQLKGHSLGNIFLSASEKMTGSFSYGLKMVEKVLDIKGRVLPVTNDNVNLCIKLKNGKVLKSENEINHYKNIQRIGIEKIYLEPRAKASREVLGKIKEADVIVIGPGNHYCSIVPNLIVEGIPEAIQKSKATVIYVCNLVNKKGHTENFHLNDYVEEINSFFKKPRIDKVLFNTKQPTREIKDKYEFYGEDLIKFKDKSNLNYEVVEADILSDIKPQYSKADSISKIRSFIRHDPDKLAREIINSIKQSV